MASMSPLTGSELIDCARANALKGVNLAASRCGYGDDVSAFEMALRKAGEHIGVDINRFDDLLQSPDKRQDVGVEISPESLSEL